jgi:hypothetical protein
VLLRESMNYRLPPCKTVRVTIGLSLVSPHSALRRATSLRASSFKSVVPFPAGPQSWISYLGGRPFHENRLSSRRQPAPVLGECADVFDDVMGNFFFHKFSIL